MKKILCLLLAFALLFGLCACSDNSSVVLFFPTADKAQSFDPQIASLDTERVIVRNCFEGLVRHDENGKIIPAAALSWEQSADGLSYTFHLRENAKWHLTVNAEEQLEGKLPENFDLSVTANDFVFALRRAAAPATAAPEAYQLINIENAGKIAAGTAEPESLGVSAPDKYTLVIRLSRAQSNFLDVLTQPVAMPCNETFFNACSGRYGTYIKFLLSNGPFYLSRFNEDSYRINRASDYSGSSPAVPDAVWFYLNTDKAQLIADIEKGEYSGALLNSYMFAQLESTEKLNVLELKNVLRSLIFNLKDPLLSEENLRKAFIAASDTARLCENAGKTPVKGMVPSCAASEKVSAHPELYSEEKAAAYLETALQKLSLQSVSVTLICENEYADIMRRLLQEWQRILGVSASLSVKAVDKAQLDAAVESGEYQIAFYPVSAHSDNAYDYFGAFTPLSPYNFTGYNDPVTVTLLSGLCAGGDAEYTEGYELLENKLAAAGIMLPVWEESSYFVTEKNVSGVIFEIGSDRLYLHNASDNKK